MKCFFLKDLYDLYCFTLWQIDFVMICFSKFPVTLKYTHTHLHLHICGWETIQLHSDHLPNCPWVLKNYTCGLVASFLVLYLFLLILVLSICNASKGKKGGLVNYLVRFLSLWGAFSWQFITKGISCSRSFLLLFLLCSSHNSSFLS